MHERKDNRKNMATENIGNEVMFSKTTYKLTINNTRNDE